MPNNEGLVMAGQLNKITTTTDGGWRISFDLPGDAVTGVSATALATMRGANLEIKIKETK